MPALFDEERNAAEESSGCLPALLIQQNCVLIKCMGWFVERLRFKYNISIIKPYIRVYKFPLK